MFGKVGGDFTTDSEEDPSQTDVPTYGAPLHSSEDNLTSTSGLFKP